MNFTIHLLLMSNNILSISADTSKEILISIMKYENSLKGAT